MKKPYEFPIPINVDDSTSRANKPADRRAANSALDICAMVKLVGLNWILAGISLIELEFQSVSKHGDFTK